MSQEATEQNRDGNCPRPNRYSKKNVKDISEEGSIRLTTCEVQVRLDGRAKMMSRFLACG